MKRVIAWMLVLVLCLGLFAGCKKNKDTDPTTGDTTVSTAGLEAALEYIKTVYRKPSEKTPKDYQRIGVVPVNGVDYEVVWSADVGEEYIKVVKGNDGMVTIDVNENVEAEVKYVLTATISDAAGNSVSHSWKHLIPTAGNMLSIVEDAYKLEPGEAFDYEVTLTGKITAINTPWDAGYKNITVTIVVEGAEDKPIMCYRLAGEGADKLKPNDIITVTGTIKNYNGTIEFDAGCTLDAVIEGEEIKAPEDPKQIIKEAYELAEGGALPYKATLTGKITKINTEYNPGYKNVTVTIVVDGDKDHPIQCYRLAGDGADKIGEGDTITVTGWIVNYKGTVQFGQGCTLDSWKDTGANVPKPEDTFTTTLVPEIVTEPKAGVAYKFFMYQKNYEKNFYLNGEMDGFYYATTYDPAKAADVFVEEVSGGYRLYIMKSGVKNYIEVLRQYSSSTSKYHNNVVFSTSPTAVWKWNSAIKSFTIAIDVDGTITNFYLGTYSFYKTFSASDVARITGEDAGKMDTENFVARLATMKETKVSAQEKAFEQLKNDYPIAEGVPATIENYTRKNVYTIDGEKVTVVWTEDSEAVTIKDNGDGTVTVQVTRGEEDAPYKLTATITDGDKKLTASWDYVVSALPKTDPKDIVKEAYKLAPGTAMADPVTLSGIITEINSAYNATYGNITVTIVVEDLLDKPIMCYRMKGEGIENLAIGDNITVTGIIKNYNDTIEFDTGCTLDAAKTQAQIVDELYALESGAALEEKYTLIGVITSVDTPYSEQYGNVTVTIAVPGCEDKPVKCFRLKGEGAAELDVGYAIAVFGTLKNYNGTYEFDSGCALVDYTDPGAEEMTFREIVEAAYALEAGASLDGTHTLVGVITKVNSAYNATYGNVTVTIVVEDMTDKPIECYRLSGEGADAIAVGDAIMVTGKIKNYNGKIEFDQGCTLDAYMTPAEIVEAAYALESGESFGNKMTLTGVITEVNSAFSAQYNNITVTMAVAGCEDKPIKCYRLAGEGADVIAVGDTITVCGILTNYNGGIQYAQGTVLVSYEKNETTEPEPEPDVPAMTPQEVVEAAYALEAGAALEGTHTLTGMITEVNSPFSSQFNNVTVTIVVEGMTDMPIECFRLKGTGADAIAVGDNITVTGTIKNYNGKIEFDSGCTLDAYKTQVQIVDELYALASGAALEQKYTLTGVITEITSPYSSQYRNITVVIEVAGTTDKPIICYRLKGTGADEIAVGDTITVTGILTNYDGGTYEFGSGCTLDDYVKAQTGGSDTAAAYTRVTDLANVTDGNYVIAVLNGENYEVLGTTVTDNKINATEEIVVTDNAISEATSIWTITVDGGNITLNNGTKYLKYNSSTNFGTSNDAYNWVITETADGIFCLTASTDSTRMIGYQISGDRYGAYKSTTSEYSYELLLFKAGE